MRGKLSQPVMKGLLWLATGCFAIAIWDIVAFVLNGQWYNIIGGITLIGCGVWNVLFYWNINHPKIPDWANDAFKEHDGKEVTLYELNSPNKDGQGTTGKGDLSKK